LVLEEIKSNDPTKVLFKVLLGADLINRLDGCTLRGGEFEVLRGNVSTIKNPPARTMDKYLARKSRACRMLEILKSPGLIEKAGHEITYADLDRLQEYALRSFTQESKTLRDLMDRVKLARRKLALEEKGKKKKK
jgi:hypothetical protein